MENKIFEVSVHFYDREYNKFQDSSRLFGKDIAMQFGLEYGVCDNVESVNVVNAMTGEIFLTIQNKEVTHMVTD